ncbi:MAG: beta-class carbonic anhydrase [Candidatus Hodarchaeota archaeon]
MNSKDLEEKFKQWRNLKYYYPYSELSAEPKWRVAILTCMDCRITSTIFGIEDPGEVIIIRNAGAQLTFDSFRSLLIAIYEFNVEIIAVVGHTDCGGCMNTSKMNEILSNISNKVNRPPEDILRLMDVQKVNEVFLGFSDIENHINKTVENIRKHPLISAVEVEIIGYIYETKTGEMINLSLQSYK